MDTTPAGMEIHDILSLIREETIARPRREHEAQVHREENPHLYRSQKRTQRRQLGRNHHRSNGPRGERATRTEAPRRGRARMGAPPPETEWESESERDRDGDGELTSRQAPRQGRARIREAPEERTEQVEDRELTPTEKLNMLLWESVVNGDGSAIEGDIFSDEIIDREGGASLRDSGLPTVRQKVAKAARSLIATSFSAFDDFRPERMETMSDLTGGQKSTLAAIISLSAVPRIGMVLCFIVLLYLGYRISQQSVPQRHTTQSTTVAFTPRTDKRIHFPEQLQSPTRRGQYARVMVKPEGWKKMNFGVGMGVVWVEEKGEERKEGKEGTRMLERLAGGAGYAGVRGCVGTYWGRADYSRI